VTSRPVQAAGSLGQHRITDDLDQLLEILPAPVQTALALPEHRAELLEVVLDLGRIPEARYPGRARPLGSTPVDRGDLRAVVDRLGCFGGDNRAGIERTLHRISAIRNRQGEIVGLTCRVGRAVFGTVAMVRDLLDSGQSLLMMGRPGVGKTTVLREIARVLADDLGRRVVVIDTSNEIAGDGDIPHPAIGRARRMQVARPELQHQVMIEAVENHMPEVIVIDEIGTELEALAARTIAERGVQLVATAHGNELANLIKNPTLSDLVGGIQSVTLGDEEARRRRTQKTVLERAAEPTFPLAVEMHSRHRWLVHVDVARTVDRQLRSQDARPQVRELGPDGRLTMHEREPVEPRVPPPLLGTAAVPRRPSPAGDGRTARPEVAPESSAPTAPATTHPLRLLCCGVNAAVVDQLIGSRRWPVQRVPEVAAADAVIALRHQLGRSPEIRRQARHLQVPILVIKSDSLHQLERAVERLLRRHRPHTAARPPARPDPEASGPDDALGGLEECRLAAEQVVLAEGRPVDLLPRSDRVRQMQVDLASRYRLRSDVFGAGADRRLRLFPP
jgi:stage III sporulation protein SpoIIIAA